LAKILIVDDDPQITSLVSIALTRMGHDVEIANSGLAALDAVRSGPPEVMLLDFTMPDITGADVLEGMQSVPGAATTQVVLATGELNPGECPGVYQVLPKPYKLADLYGAVDGALAARGGAIPEAGQ